MYVSSLSWRTLPPPLLGWVHPSVIKVVMFADTTKKLAVCNQCREYIRHISKHSASQKLMIRGILEASLSPQFNVAFGSDVPAPAPIQPRVYAVDEKRVRIFDAQLTEKLCRVKPSKKFSIVLFLALSQKEQLYEANKRKSQAAFVPVNHNSVYHGGVIGKGLKTPAKASPYSLVRHSSFRLPIRGETHLCCCRLFQNLQLTFEFRRALRFESSPFFRPRDCKSNRPCGVM